MRPLSTSNYWTIACRDSTGSSPDEEKLVDQEVLQFLGIANEQDESSPAYQGMGSRGQVDSRISTDTAFHQNRVAPEQLGPVLSRSS